MSLPILTVVGATGAQGSSVVSVFASAPNPQYHIRALTSDISTPSAIRIATLPNVSVIYTDLSSTDSLISAFKDSTFIFANTYFPPPVFLDGGPLAAQNFEAEQGLNIVTAASKIASLKHIIWSTLPDSLEFTQGRYDIPHFQSKIPAQKFLLDPQNGLNEKTTFLRVGLYGSNLVREPYRPLHIVRSPCLPSPTLRGRHEMCA